MRCGICGSETGEGAVFCPKCGTRIGIEGKGQPDSCALYAERLEKRKEAYYEAQARFLARFEEAEARKSVHGTAKEERVANALSKMCRQMAECMHTLSDMMEDVISDIKNPVGYQASEERIKNAVQVFNRWKRLSEEKTDIFVYAAMEGMAEVAQWSETAMSEADDMLREAAEFLEIAREAVWEVKRSFEKTKCFAQQSSGYAEHVTKQNALPNCGGATYGTKGGAKRRSLRKWISDMLKKDDEKPFVETMTLPKVSFRDLFSEEEMEELLNGDMSDHDYVVTQKEENVMDISSFDVSRVEFSAVVKKRAMREEYLPIHIIMYEEAFRRMVEEKLDDTTREEKGGDYIVPLQSTVKVVLSAKDVEIEDDTEERIWQGRYIDFAFMAYVPQSYERKQIAFSATVYTNDVIATKLKFVVDIEAPWGQKTEMVREDITSAFVSYSSDDRLRVASIVQGMQKVRPDLDLFMDVESLRSGEDWETQLKSEINKRDVLYLCWSRAAQKSEWVDFEWRYALVQKGDACIEPVPIEPPELCKPPEELRKKHFNDKMVYMVKALEYMSRKQAYLILQENGAERKVPVDKSRFVLGRGQADYVFSNRKISMQHAEITREQEIYFITDLASTNKTYVDGAECVPGERTPLGDGSKLMLADLEIAFVLE